MKHLSLVAGILLAVLLLAASTILWTSDSLAASPEEGFIARASPAEDGDPRLSERSALSHSFALTDTTPSTIDYIIYLRSRPQDNENCMMTAVDGELLVDPAITNPAMSCPDMFAWKIMIEAIQNEFWKEWAPDAYVFPSEPLPLCETDASDPSTCCTPGSLTNPGYDDPEDPGKHCPYFPADHLDQAGEPILIPANSPAVGQDGHFQITEVGTTVDEGRALRQEVAEVVFRNEAMFDYLFENNIYHTDGLAAVWERASTAMATGAPVHSRNESGELNRIDFPIPSVMVKTNWIHEDRAAAMGIINDPDNPFIAMEIRSPVIDNFGTTLAPGLHYLIAIHISTKDTPNWVWATFEHVNNPGRCDITGCSDSFGYATPDAVTGAQYDNLVAPNQRSDDTVRPTTIFDPWLVYGGGAIRPALEDIFQALEIGTASESAASAGPSIVDPGWRSYRLKGAQVDFVDGFGQPTLLGNSVTEGGFVQNSSCISCHARSAIDATGQTPYAVWQSRLSADGYPQSVSGPPLPEHYFTTAMGERFATTPEVRAISGDFAWGFMFAKPLDSSGE